MPIRRVHVIDPSTGLGWGYDSDTGDAVLVRGTTVLQRVTPAGLQTMLGVSGFVSSEARGDILRRGASGWERHSAKTAGQIPIGDGTDVVSTALTGDVTVSGAGVTAIGAAKVLASMVTGEPNIDFTQEPEVALFAKTTGEILTAANAQQDFFRVGRLQHYFELAQGVGATGANTLLAANGLTPSTTGWLLTLDNTATDSLEITEGIVLGSAKSYVAGTSAAFRIRAAFLITTRANITHLGIGFRELGAYATANTAAEWATAYPEKAMIGIVDNAGAFGTKTSKANADVETALAHVAHVDGDIVALEVNVSAAGVVTYRLATGTPAGSTAAQTQAAVTAAYAALAADASAVAFTFTAAAVLVPSIIIGASGAAAPDVKLVNYFRGAQ